MINIRKLSGIAFVAAFIGVATSAWAAGPASTSVYSGYIYGPCMTAMSQAKAINAGTCGQLADQYGATSFSVTHHESEFYAWALCKKMAGTPSTSVVLRSTCNFNYEIRPRCGGATGIRCQ